MRVFLREGGGHARPVAGPGDLAGRTGVALIEGPATDDEVSLWAVSLGLFAGRGGEIRRLA